MGHINNTPTFALQSKLACFEDNPLLQPQLPFEFPASFR